jgi:CBS domain containing-hemolysin-like protein
MTFFFLAIAIALLLLNAFFVLAEFAAVKMRPSRIEELIDANVRGAKAVKDIQLGLDDYLSVCQLGITFASIGLGFVAEPAIVRLIEPIVAWSGMVPAHSNASWWTTHGIAFTISYAIVSYLHILIGELVPKSIAIRLTDRASLLTAPLLKFFFILFFIPLRGLTASANLLLQWCGVPFADHGAMHSEEELRILLNKGQTEGMMSFRRLLFLENVFDLGELRVRDAMRPRSQVKTLDARKGWAENLKTIRRFRFTRYPLVLDDTENPIGLVHLKDALMADEDEADLKALSRPFITTNESVMLETLLADMQRRRIHAALVRDAEGKWTGFLTLEDVIEEIIGTIRDEFEDEEQIHLADALTEARVHLDIQATNTVQAIREAVNSMAPETLPVPKDVIVRAIEEREKTVETYLGNHFGMPHARVAGLNKPVLMVLRAANGITYRGTTEKADLLIVLLTPAGQPRTHQRLQAAIATIMDESDFIPQRLRTAVNPSEIVEILLTGEQATLD